MTTTTTRIPAPDYVEGAVLLDEVGPQQWRVLDARAPEECPDAILGFVCSSAGLYEVTSLRDPQRVCFCADLDAVHAVFADAA